MDPRKRTVAYEQDNVIVTIFGPMKDEVNFIGKLMIVEEAHGAGIEWVAVKVKSGDSKGNSPDLESCDWEDVSTSVGYRASHDDSLDAVEIKPMRLPNPIKFDIGDLKCYKRIDNSERHKVIITFLLKDGTNVPSFQLDSCDFGDFFSHLDNYVRFKKSKKESNLYLLVDPKVDALDKSFSELDLFSESKSHIIHSIIKDPYTTALGGFSKISNFLYDYMVSPIGSESQAFTSSVNISEIISENILNVDINHSEEPGYELITCIELPPRPSITREEPLGPEEWLTFVDSEGRIKDFSALKRRVFRGGLVHSIRKEAWKYLLDFYNPEFTNKEKILTREKKSEAYFRMKLQWKSFTADQESRFSALRDRKSLIEISFKTFGNVCVTRPQFYKLIMKSTPLDPIIIGWTNGLSPASDKKKDVSRTDRTHPFFEGDGNPNIQMLQDILMTYCMYNFDLGYVQGMSDLLSPILVVMQDEVDAFWCFAGWLKLIGSNFELEQQGMKNQLQDLHRLLHFVDSNLCNYLEKHESGNMYFAFRWLLILFKRDFKFMEIMRLWEVLWTGLPCKSFHLLICIAILDTEKLTITENGYGLTEILKHVNEMSYKINLEDTLGKAEAIYLQIKSSRYRSDVVETILGLEHVVPEVAPVPKPPVPAPRQANGVAASRHSSNSASSTENIDEYVDLEPTYPTLFDLPF